MHFQQFEENSKYFRRSMPPNLPKSLVSCVTLLAHGLTSQPTLIIIIWPWFLMYAHLPPPPYKITATGLNSRALCYVKLCYFGNKISACLRNVDLLQYGQHSPGGASAQVSHTDPPRVAVHFAAPSLSP